LVSRQDKDQRVLEVELTREYIGIKYDQYIQVFPDASKDPQNAGGDIIPRMNVTRGERITGHVSVFTGELLEIMVALNNINEMEINKSLICSDSSSALCVWKLKNQKLIVFGDPTDSVYDETDK